MITVIETTSMKNVCLLGEGGLMLCCTGPTHPNFRQIKIIIVITVLHPDVFWAHRFLEVKDWIVYWYPKNPMVITECPKIVNFQCIWGRTFVSLEKICF